MANRFKEKMSSYTECAICGQNYTRPKHLQPCLHIFCENCIEQWAHHQAYGGSFPCPLCKADIQIPYGGVKNFPTSFLINNIVDDLNKLAPNEKPCGRHPEEMLNLICKECNLYICADCIADHPYHSIKSLKTEKKSVTESIIKRVAEAKSKVAEWNDVADQIRAVIGDYEGQYSGGTEAVTALMIQIQKICRDKMAKIAGECEPERQRLHEYLKKVDTSIQDMNELIKKADKLESAADLKNDQELLKNFEEIMEKKHTADVVAKLKITTNKSTTLKQIEKLVDKMVEVEDIENDEGLQEQQNKWPREGAIDDDRHESNYDSREYAKAARDTESLRSKKKAHFDESERTKNETERTRSSRDKPTHTSESERKPWAKRVDFEEGSERKERGAHRPGTRGFGETAAFGSDRKTYTKNVDNEEGVERREREAGRPYSSPGTMTASPGDDSSPSSGVDPAEAAFFATARLDVNIKKTHEFDPGMNVNDITVTDSGNIIVANRKQVKRFLPSGKMKWESELPIGNVTIHNGYLYGTSSETRNLYKMNLDGQKLDEKYLAFTDPQGIAFNSRGAHYITSGSTNEIYRKRGEKETYTMFLWDAMSQGRANVDVTCPLYITIDKDDSVLVTSHYGGYVYKFDKRGQFLWSVPVSQGCCEPCGIATDSRGHIFVAAYAKDSIYQISPDGKNKKKIGSKKDGLDHPRAVAIWGQKKQLVVGQNDKILVFQL